MLRKVVNRIARDQRVPEDRKYRPLFWDQFDCGIPDPTILPENPEGLEMASPDDDSTDETLALPPSSSEGGQAPVVR